MAWHKQTIFASAFSDVTLTVLSALDAAKAAAKTELENYFAAIDPADYRPAQQDELTAAVDGGNGEIDAATDIDAVNAALAAAKATIDAIKTDAQLTADELAADKAAADAVEAKIDAIGEVEYTDACKAKIDEARAAYDALTPAQAALVENADALTAAVARYEELKAAAEAPASPAGSNVCSVCGKAHKNTLTDTLVAILHRYMIFFRSLAKSLFAPA